MPFRSRQATRLRPVKSLKHIIDSRTAVIDGLVTTVPLAETVAVANLASTTEVEDGSNVSSIYLKVEALTTAIWSLQPAVYLAVFKNPGNNLSTPNPNNMGPSDVKRFVIHQEMVMLAQNPADGAQFPRTVFNGVIKIPRGYRRFGYADKLLCLLQGPGGTGTSQMCVQCIYKEFR